MHELSIADAVRAIAERHANGRTVTLQPALTDVTLDHDTTFMLVATGPPCAWWVRLNRYS